ncbi:MAG: hypothetical protein O3A93_11305 [Chloroflexi bacterium]|nr:hypothetical protein [Chloroflexota bacterium]MDA1271826.1 hypothetical protein [Chloroflexota bacterium]PKB58297.1 MAG: hypothetical protein BZY83_07735 [SAR202 cluster bacterium Casp-Chloro-G2]
MTLRGRGSLTGSGITRAQLRQGGGRGNGNDHLDELVGATELFVYQTPNTKPKGFDSLKLFLEASECELIFTLDVPPELRNYEAFRITHKSGEKIPEPVLRRCHSWAHGRNYLHSFFKPMYGSK